MKDAILWAVGGLLLGGILHIASVLWVPVSATNDSWTQITALGPPNTMHIIPPASSQRSVLADMDPSLRYAVCRYDLSDGPLQIIAQLPLVYWSVALYDRRGLNYYALNDRLVAGRSIRLWIATEKQLLAIEPQSAETPEGEERLLVGAPGPLGFAVFRSLVPNASYEASVDEALKTTSCTPFEPVAARQLLSHHAKGQTGSGS